MFYDLTVPGAETYLAEGVWHHNSGKTASGAGGLAEWVLSDVPDADDDGTPREYGIIGPTYADAWTKCVEGEAGILRQLGTSMAQIKEHRSATVRAAWRTYGQVVLHNGVVIYVDSAAEGGLRIQGRNLRGAWADEIGLWLNWEVAWKESLNYAVRKGRSQILATGTPKASRPARKLIRGLIKNDPEYGGVIVRKLRTIDNAANLSKAFLRAVVGAARGTRLERQELEGELLDDVANALWTRDLLERIVVPGVGEPGGPKFLRNVVIGVDPSDGKEDSDEQAYTIIGEGLVDEKKIYVAENWGGQEAPAPFARRVLITAANWNASIVVEKNHGGEWLVTVFEQVAKELIEKKVIKAKPRVRVVHASQAKRTRAEPVSALYERDLVRHCHRTRFTPCNCEDGAHPEGHHRPDEDMPELEDQMCIAEGELITTGRGSVPVEDVRRGDLVLTRTGWYPVRQAGYTCVKPTVTISTGLGRVTCSTDHPVYVSGYGFIRADEVQSGDTMIACPASPSGRASSSAERSFTSTTTATTNPAGAGDASCSTGRYGLLSTARYRPAGMSITGKAAGTTTASGILPPCQRETTTGITTRSAGRSGQRPGKLRSEAASAERNGHPGDLASTSARSAEGPTNPGPTSRRSTARGNAVTVLRAVSVQSVIASGVQPVYDISVGGPPEFFAGGLLVHNSTFTGAQGERSPDRLDSLVWAMSTMLRKTFGVPGGRSGRRDWAAQEEIDQVGSTPEQRISRRIASAHGGAYAERDNWDLDDFAPRHDESPELDQGPVRDQGVGNGRRGRRGNVRQWGGS